MTAANKSPFGLTSAVCLVVANMIGAGVFTTSGFALADLGDRRTVMLAWIVGGLIALCGALSYGGLSRRISGSGGEYLFLSRTIHPLAGFLAGWVSLLAGFTGAIAFAATAFETYVLPDSVRPAGLPTGGLAVTAIVACGLLHSLHIRPGILAQNAVVAVKLSVVFGFLAFAFWHWRAGHWPGWEIKEAATDVSFSVHSFALSLVWISLSYSGFNAAVYVAGEVDNPHTNVPRALWVGTLTTFIIYLLLNLVFLFAAQPQKIAGQPDVAAVAAQAIGGSGSALAVRTLIALALLSSVSSMIVAGPRVYARMADDGVMPRWLRMQSGRPLAAVWLQVAIAVVVVCVAQLNQLLSYLGLTLSLSAAGAVTCLFVIRRREGRSAVAIPGYPLTPLIFVSATVLLALLSASQRPKEFVAMVITMVSGAIVYFVFRKSARPSSTLLLVAVTCLVGHVGGIAHAQSPPRGETARDVFAWCIVPFDSQKRTPQQRIAMLQQLGIGSYAYDWRQEHLDTMVAELRLARENDIHIQAVWMWIDAQSDSPVALSENNERVLANIRAANLTTQIWVGFHANYFQGKSEAEALTAGSKMVAYLAKRAEKMGCRVALYNHGDWLGEPANQIKIIKQLPKADIGIVYNFHHGHEHIDGFGELARQMKPYLWAVNLNGMRKGGPQILPLGEGDAEAGMLAILHDIGFNGPFGILGHIADQDVKEVLEKNLAGFKQLLVE